MTRTQVLGASLLTVVVLLIALGVRWDEEDPRRGRIVVDYQGDAVGEATPTEASLALDRGGLSSANSPPAGSRQSPENADDIKDASAFSIKTTDLDPSSQFEEKYRHFSYERLVDARKDCRDELRQLKKRIYEQRHQAGLYSVFPFEYDEEGNVKPASETIRSGTLPSYNTIYRDDDANQWHSVLIPQEEYPEVYEKRRESQWLHKRAEHLKSG